MRGSRPGVGLAVIVTLAVPIRAAAAGYAHGSAVAPSTSGELIEPELLKLHASDLPGFSRGKTSYLATALPRRWAEGEGTAAEAKREYAYLIREGFVEGVAETILAKGREAVGEALVFETSSAAQTTIKRASTELSKPVHKESLVRFGVPGIPGSLGFGFHTPKERGAASNVMFATGRCFVLVADRVVDARTLAQANRAPVAAAKTLYGRISSLCA
jgi:hypothetical protein